MFRVIIAGGRDLDNYEQMALNADALVAFWDGQSKGTKHMIRLAQQHNLKTRDFN